MTMLAYRFVLDSATGEVRRVAHLTHLRVLTRADDAPAADGVIGTLEGYAAVFNQWSETLADYWFPFREKIEPGAFKKTLKEGDARALVNHNPDLPLARVSAGNLRLSEDGEGLRSEIDLLDTSYARDLLANVRAGVVSGMSFAFDVIKESWRWAKEPGEVDERTLLEVRLYEVSPTAFPAYPDTSLAARSLVEATGVDLAAIGRIAARARLGLPARPGDIAAARASLPIVSSFLPPAEPAATGDHSAGRREEPGNHSARRLRLDAARASL